MSSCEIVLNVMPEETRAVVLEDGKPVEILVERAVDRALVGSIFVGRVDRVLPGMQCAFVDIGLPRHAFLYVTDALPDGMADDEERREPLSPDDEPDDAPVSPDAPVTSGPRARAALGKRIEELVRPGERLVVQVAREPFRQKGARVTTHLSLAGRFLVLVPGSKHLGVSKRLQPEAERERLRRTVEGLRQPDEAFGWIVRTAAAGQPAEALAADRSELLERWAVLQARLAAASPPSRVHDDVPLAIKAIRDQLGASPSRIVVDDEETREQVVRFLERNAPDSSCRVVLHSDPQPILEAMGLETDIDKALRDRVWLKSGGYLVINQLEALVAIDVNTGKFTGASGLEETALTTNLEAAKEVARQLRLRDLGGIVVVDFIDMSEPRNRRQVMDELNAALARDRAKSTVLGMSDFGLVQLTRQRQRRSLEAQLTEPCPHCFGSGRVRSVETTALQALRRLRAVAHGPVPPREVRVKAHPAVVEALRVHEAAARGTRHALPFQLELVPEPERSPQVFDIGS